jgi:hypothetical protein
MLRLTAQRASPVFSLIFTSTIPAPPTTVKSLRIVYQGRSYKPSPAQAGFHIAPLVPEAAPDEDLTSHPNIPSSATLKRWVLIKELPGSLPEPFAFTLVINLRSRRRIRKRCKLPLSGG